MHLTLHVWRQRSSGADGEMVVYDAPGISPDMSFLEMLDVMNERLTEADDPRGPIAFDHDCREGICGTCGVVINGVAHGPRESTTTSPLAVTISNAATAVAKLPLLSPDPCVAVAQAPTTDTCGNEAILFAL